MEKKVLITGGTGFIGKALTKKMLENGYKVRILTRKAPAKSNGGVEYVQGSYDNTASLTSAVSGCSAIFHLAAAISGHCAEDYELANALATANLVSACIAAHPQPESFIYVSSLAAGGPSSDPGDPRTEAKGASPASDYGRTKLAGEKELDRLPQSIKRVTLRPPIVYGKNDAGISKIARWVKRGFMVNMCQGETFFSFIFLDDLVDALYTALANPATNGKTYYVCEDKTYTWTFFIAELARAMNKKMPFMLTMSPCKLRLLGKVYSAVSKVLGTEPVFNPDKAREASAGHWIASPKLWMRDTDWKGWTPLSDGIKKTFS